MAMLMGIVIFSAIQSAMVKLYVRADNDAMVFNLVKALTACVFLALLSLADFDTNFLTIIYGGLYGILLAASMYSGYMALATGPLSLTSMIVAFSVIIPLFYGVLFCKETLSAVKIIGLILLTAAMVSANIKKPEMTGRTSYARWLFCVFATFLCNGFCSVLQKLHQQQYPGEYYGMFTLFSMAACGLIFLAAAIIKKKNLASAKGKSYAAVSGIAMAAASFLTIKLSGMENASVLFPAISAGTICASLFCGSVIFKERLKCSHIIALVCGIAAIVCLKL